MIKVVSRLRHLPALQRPLRAAYRLFEDLVQGDTLQANSSLRQLYPGARCFILCTGQSLKEIDVSLLKGEHIFGTGHLHSPHLDYRVRPGMSGTIAHDSGLRINPSFYAVIDPIWPLLHKNGGAEFFLKFCRSAEQAFGDPRTVFFLSGASRRFVQRHRLFAGRRVHYVKSQLPMALATHQSNDLTKRITFLDGSVFFMIAAAIYMGFKELYLCGCDYTYQPLRLGHFYADWTRFSDAPVDQRHYIAKSFADARGVRILNVVPDGFESPVYEKTSWAVVKGRLLARRSPQPTQADGGTNE